MHEGFRGSSINRRTLLRGAAVAGAAVAAGAAVSGGTPAVRAHNMPLEEFRERYEAAVNRPALHRQLHQFVNVSNDIIWSNVRNGLNGSELSYGEPPGSLAVVVQGYASANIATYNDAIWEKYQLGAKHGVRDPQTGQPATRNIFYPRTTTGGADLPVNDPQSLYNDIGMIGLMERGVVFLTWHQTVHGHAGLAVSDNRNPDNLTVAQVTDEIMANLVPGAIAIPAAVFEIVRLQEMGYKLVVNH